MDKDAFLLGKAIALLNEMEHVCTDIVVKSKGKLEESEDSLLNKAREFCQENKQYLTRYYSENGGH